MRCRRQLLKTARSGDAQSQFELGCAYNFEPPRKRRLAVYWYHKAAEQGHATAQNYLGESYRDGSGVKRDRRKAMHWFRLAAEQGESDAQLSLGYQLFYGEGAKRDRPQALAWYRKAAKIGNAAAMANIGDMYRHGHAVTQSWTLAIR